LRELFERAEREALGQLEFLDLDWNVVEREIARTRRKRRAGPTAEAILRELGSVASQIR
jgi:pyruvate ferredoxin oxidoreductase alpha subunit